MFDRRRKFPEKFVDNRALRDTYKFSAAENNFVDTLKNFEAEKRDCAYHGSVLMWIAAKKYRERRRLNLLAGFMALFSSAAIVSVANDYLTSSALKWLGAIGAFSSGLISLLTNAMPGTDRLQKMTAASSALKALQRSIDPAIHELDLALSENALKRMRETKDTTKDIQSGLDQPYREAAKTIDALRLETQNKRTELTRDFELDITDAILAHDGPRPNRGGLPAGSAWPPGKPAAR